MTFDTKEQIDILINEFIDYTIRPIMSSIEPIKNKIFVKQPKEWEDPYKPMQFYIEKDGKKILLKEWSLLELIHWYEDIYFPLMEIKSKYFIFDKLLRNEETNNDK